MKKILISTLVLALVFASICFAVNFPDVSGHWAEPYITELTDKGIINGYDDGSFRPNGAIKNSEFLKLIMTASLPDVDWTQKSGKYDHWAGLYIEMAERYGVIDEGEFALENLNDEITRITVARVLAKCDISIKKALQQGAPAEFYDIQNISEEDYYLLSHCVAQGYITGYEDSTFKPDNTLKRGEVAAILSRYLNK